jgi:UPF0716 protein FxsA
MFSGPTILILSLLGVVDLIILLLISRGIGIPVIIISQSASAAVGIWKIRKMDFNLFFYLDAELKKGEPIVRELWEEALLLTGACLLIVPGFLSDLVGIAFLIPHLRTFCLEFMHVN